MPLLRVAVITAISHHTAFIHTYHYVFKPVSLIINKNIAVITATHSPTRKPISMAIWLFWGGGFFEG